MSGITASGAERITELYGERDEMVRRLRHLRRAKTLAKAEPTVLVEVDGRRFSYEVPHDYLIGNTIADVLAINKEIAAAGGDPNDGMSGVLDGTERLTESQESAA